MAGRGSWKTSAVMNGQVPLAPASPQPDVTLDNEPISSSQPSMPPTTNGFSNHSGAATGGFSNRESNNNITGAGAGRFAASTGFEASTGFKASTGFGGSGGDSAGSQSRGQGCFKCNQSGHMARDCPNAASNGGGARAGGGTCYKCNEPGHMARDCPNQQSGGGGGGTCHKCNEPGHMARDCPTAGSETCYKCNQVGHISRDCPNRVGGDAALGDRPVQESYIPTEHTVDELSRLSVKSGVNVNNFEQFEVELTGSNRVPPIRSLKDVGVPDSVLQVAEKFGVSSLLPVQAYAIPIVLAGRDLMACAQTGSGKTLAYLLPLIRLLLDSPDNKGTVFNNICYPTALIVLPTRELATQVYDLCKVYFEPVGLKVQRIHGNIQHNHLARSLQSGANALVATCGRLKDFMNRNIISLARTRYIVLDEADRMLDDGFQQEVVLFMQSADKHRQVVMFSATYPAAVQALASSYLAQDYLFLSIGRIGAANPDVSQEMREVAGSDKVPALLALLEEFRNLSPDGFGNRKVLVFVERKETANIIGLLLCDKGFPATNNHGDRPPTERQNAFTEFRLGTTPIMVTTNVLARGVDISGISLVINYDLPQDDSTYVHRIGRTGRCGNLGRSVSFFDPNVDAPTAHALVSTLREAQQPVPDWLEAFAEGDDFFVGGGRGRGRGLGNRDIRHNVGRSVDVINDGFGDGGGGAGFQPLPARVPQDDDWS